MIYLDNAATTLIKPRAVEHAIVDAIRHTAGYARGNHKAAERAGEIVYLCREQAAALFGLDDPARVVFTLNATHALNLAIHALAKPKTRVAVSGYEHNAVLRPLALRDIEPIVLQSTLWETGGMVVEAKQAIDDGAELFILNHVSNVFGQIAPIDQIAMLLEAADIPLILDASQSAGVLEIDVRRWRCLAAVCMPGHKGLYGPPGTGILLALDDRIAANPLLAGGTGSVSEQVTQPDFLPDALESGTPNLWGIAGLAAGLQFVRSVGPQRILDHERALMQEFARQLEHCNEVEVFAHPQQTGVVSLRAEGQPSELLAQRLAEAGICTRAGLHCAPLAHRSAGTEETGTVRFSASFYQTAAQVEQAAEQVCQSVKNL